MKNKPIIIISGDPKSTFNEILIKTLKNKVLKNIKFPIIIIGSKKLLNNELKKSKTKISFQKFDEQTNLLRKKIYIVDIPLDFKKLTTVKKNLYIKKSFELGLKLINDINSLALINGPISKTTFLKGKYNGITEYLAFKTGSENEIMLIFNKQLSVSPITTHIPISQVEKKIKKKIIINKIKSISDFYKKFLGFKPNIAVTGLNPHCETFVKKNIDDITVEKLIKFSNKFGLAFQIRDDILDEIGDEIKIGKPIKSDIKNNKSTYPSIIGIEKSQKKAELLISEALKILNELPFKTDKLEFLCELVINRKN